MLRIPKLSADEIWKTKTEKINGELFVMTYGALVAQLMKDLNGPEQVNSKLEKMGYSIGTRIIDDYLARTAYGKCADFKETAEQLAKVAIKIYFGVSGKVGNWSADSKEFSLILDENPLNEFVELPVEIKERLWYSNILCGIIQGALEMVYMEVKAEYVQDKLRGDPNNEIRVKLIRLLEEEVPPSED